MVLMMRFTIVAYRWKMSWVFRFSPHQESCQECCSSLDNEPSSNDTKDSVSVINGKVLLG